MNCNTVISVDNSFLSILIAWSSNLLSWDQYRSTGRLFSAFSRALLPQLGRWVARLLGGICKIVAELWDIATACNAANACNQAVRITSAYIGSSCITSAYNFTSLPAIPCNDANTCPKKAIIQCDASLCTAKDSSHSPTYYHPVPVLRLPCSFWLHQGLNHCLHR